MTENEEKILEASLLNLSDEIVLRMLFTVMKDWSFEKAADFCEAARIRENIDLLEAEDNPNRNQINKLKNELNNLKEKHKGFYYNPIFKN